MQLAFPPATIVGSQVHILPSALIGEDYEIAIWLPPGYVTSSSHRYPVLYILDAPVYFGLAVPIVLGQIWEQLVPELLIVGIGKQIKSLDDWWPIRGRDYSPKPLSSDPGSGHGERFLEFIRSELVPYIDANFQTDPADRTIWGQSLGGTLVLSALFATPHLFQRYIATSPDLLLEGAMLLDSEERLLPMTISNSARLFISVGSQDHEYGPHIEAFIAALTKRHYPELVFETATLEGYPHLSAGPIGFIQGLQAVFSDR